MENVENEGAARRAAELQQARTPGEFVALLRRVKEASGLTYRELELRAAERGDLLARSTLAGALSRDALPKPELLVALVRVCEGEERVGVWLAARERIAASPVSAATSAPTSALASAPGPESESESEVEVEVDQGTAAARTPVLEPPSGPRRHRPKTLALIGGAVVAVALTAVATAVALNGSGDGSSGGPGGDSERSAAEHPAAREQSVPTGEVRVRPARAPGLCLTDGTARGKGAKGAYGMPVAVFRPCAGAVPPTTSLVPVGGGEGDGGRWVQWVHPDKDKGKGCLKAYEPDAKYAARGLLEPTNHCEGATPFDVDPRGEGRFALRFGDGWCVGVRAAGESAGAVPVARAEAVVQRCGAGKDQLFAISKPTSSVRG
ncbi:hypothetical protein [Streptomyces sp. NPDC059009]|uniref:hypothetical protein n=1 Tax=Streptomyces sp. NPDC059009 TaxID=3346694 RepID=UPI0036A244C3